jgi:hypothetical protein
MKKPELERFCFFATIKPILPPEAPRVVEGSASRLACL